MGVLFNFGSGLAGPSHYDVFRTAMLANYSCTNNIRFFSSNSAVGKDSDKLQAQTLAHNSCVAHCGFIGHFLVRFRGLGENA